MLLLLWRRRPAPWVPPAQIAPEMSLQLAPQPRGLVLQALPRSLAAAAPSRGIVIRRP